MTWSYSGNPSSSPKDEVRYLLQDTDTDNQLMSDEELAYLIARWGSPYMAAYYAALTLSMRYAAQVDTSVDRVSESASQRSAAYRAIAEAMLVAAQTDCLPSIGGRKLDEKQALADDPNAVQPEIRKDQFDYPGRSEL